MSVLRFSLLSVIIKVLLVPAISWATETAEIPGIAGYEIPFLKLAATDDNSSETVSEKFITRVGVEDIGRTLALWGTETSKKMKVHFIDVPMQVRRQMTQWLSEHSVTFETSSFSLPARTAARVTEAFHRRFPRVEGQDITLALVRGPLVAGSSVAGLWVSGVPLPAAALIGVTLGMSSGSIQLFMKYWEEFLNKSDAWGEKLGVHVRRAKFMAVEFALLAVQPAVFLTLGLVPAAHFDAVFWGWFAFNGLLTTATQGEWERQLMALKKRLINKGLSHDIRGWDIMALGAMTGSLVWIGSAIIGISGEMLNSSFIMGLSMSGYAVLFAGSRVLQVLNQWNVTDYDQFKRKLGEVKPVKNGKRAFLNLIERGLHRTQSRRCMNAVMGL